MDFTLALGHDGMILRIIGYKIGRNNTILTSIIKEFLETKITECNEI